MQLPCHRCHGELPSEPVGSMQSNDDILLFCPRCSAPQLLLPEHLQSEKDSRSATTGATPPPRLDGADPRQIEWRVVLQAAGFVACIVALLRLLGLRFDLFNMFWFFWLVSGPGVTLNSYVRRRPMAWMNARVGLRVGVVTGLLMLAAVSVCVGGAGVVQRYGLHDMAQADEQTASETKAMQVRVQAWMQQQNVDPETQKNYAAVINSPLMISPEMRAGSTLAGYGLAGLLLLLLCGGVGSLTGMLRGARVAHERRNG